MDIQEKQFYELNASEGYYLTLAKLEDENNRTFATSHCWLGDDDSIENWTEWTEVLVIEWEEAHKPAPLIVEEAQSK